MGLWQVGPYGVQHDRTDAGLIEGYKQILPDYETEDAIGSPYSITDYICNKELCPNGDEDLIWLRKKLNEMGIKLMVDFVPNHSALDSPWVDENIDYFVCPHTTNKSYGSIGIVNDEGLGYIKGIFGSGIIISLFGLLYSQKWYLYKSGW